MSLERLLGQKIVLDWTRFCPGDTGGLMRMDNDSGEFRHPNERWLQPSGVGLDGQFIERRRIVFDLWLTLLTVAVLKLALVLEGFGGGGLLFDLECKWAPNWLQRLIITTNQRHHRLCVCGCVWPLSIRLFWLKWFSTIFRLSSFLKLLCVLFFSQLEDALASWDPHETRIGEPEF